MSLSPLEQDAAIDLLIAAVQVPSVSNTGPLDGSYDAIVDLFARELREIRDMEVFILPESIEHKPILVGVLKGSLKRKFQNNHS